jgi:hypothetical protein
VLIIDKWSELTGEQPSSQLNGKELAIASPATSNSQAPAGSNNDDANSVQSEFNQGSSSQLNSPSQLSDSSQLSSPSNRTDAEQAELRARQQQVINLLVEADSLAPLASLDVEQSRQLLQNYQRVLLLDEANQKARSGIEKTIARIKQSAQSALLNENLQLFQQYKVLLDNEPLASVAVVELEQSVQDYQNQQEQQKVEAEQQRYIADNLSLAEQAMQASRLTKPLDNSAVFYYQNVLERDSNNQQASNGLAAILDRLIKNTEQHVKSEALASAQTSFNSLKQYFPDEQRLPELAKRIEQLKRDDAIKRQAEQRAAAAAAEEQARLDKLADPLVQLSISSKLNAAKEAFAANNLVGQDEDNALAKYRQILAIDDRHEPALQGILEIEAALVELINKAIQDGQSDEALGWLQKIKQYFPNNSAIALLQQQVDEMAVMSQDTDNIDSNEPKL